MFYLIIKKIISFFIIFLRNFHNYFLNGPGSDGRKFSFGDFSNISLASHVEAIANNLLVQIGTFEIIQGSIINLISQQWEIFQKNVRKFEFCNNIILKMNF